MAQLDFLGSVHVPPKFEYYCIGINFDIGKKFSQPYYNTIKMKICYDPRFIDIVVTMAM